MGFHFSRFPVAILERLSLHSFAVPARLRRTSTETANAERLTFRFTVLRSYRKRIRKRARRRDVKSGKTFSRSYPSGFIRCPRSVTVNWAPNTLDIIVRPLVFAQSFRSRSAFTDSRSHFRRSTFRWPDTISIFGPIAGQTSRPSTSL